jgi:hypothetical protein
MSPAHGCLKLDAFSNSTNTNDVARAAEYALAAGRLSQKNANLNVAKRSASAIPDFSGNHDLGFQTTQNHPQQQGHYYESSRHNNKPQYPRSPAANLTPLSASTSTYFDYPSSVNAAMSLSYETRTLPTYPSMMHEQPQEQDDNDFQHHRYPSPPPPGLSENPYHPQSVDPSAGINMDMPELPQKEDSDAPSPGRSRPIPKPDREVTKGQDGRFICTWAGCTEDIKSFNRKCEWSKVSGCAFPRNISFEW